MSNLIEIDEVIDMMLKAAKNPDINLMPASMALRVLAASLKQEKEDNE